MRYKLHPVVNHPAKMESEANQKAKAETPLGVFPLFAFVDSPVRAAPEVSVTGGGQELGVVAPKVVLPYRDLFDCVFGFFFSQPISKRKDQRPEPLGPSLPVFFGVFFIPMLRFSFQMIFNRIFSIALNPSSTSRFNTNALICA